MEADVKFSTTQSHESFSTATQRLQPQVLFSGNDGDEGNTRRNHYATDYVTDDMSVDDVDDGSSDVSSIPAVSNPVLKSTATGVLRSKDYADQLQLIINHFQDSPSKDTEVSENHAHDVLTEIAIIMKKLELERTKIKDDLERERTMVVRLQGRLDSFVEKRLKELPFAVQREHEACAVDIVELQWHVAFKRRQETRINAKLQLAETLNEKLKTELSFVQEHDPKLSQKLQLENQVIVNLLQAHNNTATELLKTLKDQEKSEQESEKAEAKAEKERNYLKKEIDGVKKTLQKAMDDLSDAEKLHARQIKNIEDTKATIQETEEQTEEQMEKLERIREIEKMQEAKDKELEEKRLQAEYEARLRAEDSGGRCEGSDDGQDPH